MAETDRPVSPHLQIYRWQITMLTSILHRATGVANALGILLLVGWLIAAANGPEAYTHLRDVLASPPGLIILAGLTFSFCFHLGNGIRHLFWDLGLGFEKAQYFASGWTVVIASIVLTVVLVAIALSGGGA